MQIQYDLRLRQCLGEYRSLSNEGYRARYYDMYTLSEADARRLLNVNFRRVEATVMQALGQPAPSW